MEKIETTGRELPLPSTTRSTDLPAIIPYCPSHCGPCSLARPSLVLTLWIQLPSPSLALSLSSYPLFLLHHHVSRFLLDDPLHCTDPSSYVLICTILKKEEEKGSPLASCPSPATFLFSLGKKQIMEVVVYLLCIHFFSSHSPFFLHEVKREWSRCSCVVRSAMKKWRWWGWASVVWAVPKAL